MPEMPLFLERLFAEGGKGPRLRKDIIPIAEIAGNIAFFPFRAGNLPEFWYFCNGDQYPLTSPQGQALNGLPAEYKTDWSITVSGSNINLPNLFASDGKGYFPRAADGTARLPGSKQADAIRNIAGGFGDTNFYWYNSLASSADPIWELTLNANNINILQGTATGHKWYKVKLNVSNAVPTADENRPSNVGMTPAIFLGV
jgi:hypothetical protein